MYLYYEETRITSLRIMNAGILKIFDKEQVSCIISLKIMNENENYNFFVI